jgi:monooxygenase
MSARGYSQCVAQVTDPSVSAEPILNLTAGYVLRSIEQLPKQGSKQPWKLRMNYALDVPALRFGPLEDGAMSFSSPAPRAQALAEAAI